ncbi:MAG: hypothetical protein KTR33_16900 [Gammaproteobacteria bacterium]|nr:hypothetical protein [Gammaproteobacteria bacterium]
MSDTTKTGVHWSFWVISILMLVWNALGAVNYLGQTSPEIVASMPENHQAIILGRPAWATAGFAVAVFGGVLGCLLLLFRRSLALPVFIVSLLGVLVTTLHTFGVVQKVAFSSGELVLMVLMPIVVALLLVWYALHARKAGWLR